MLNLSFILFLLVYNVHAELHDHELSVDLLSAEYSEMLGRINNGEQLPAIKNVIDQLESLNIRRSIRSGDQYNYNNLDWFLGNKPDTQSRSLRICMVVSSLEGLFINSGIGTFYSTLADFLTKAGHSVTILYFGPIEESFIEGVALYASKGIRLITLEATVNQLQTPYFLGKTYEIYQTLRSLSQDGGFDIIHFPDWEGPGYYSLLAKQEGLAFATTLLVVGLHGPQRWTTSHKEIDSKFKVPNDTRIHYIDFMEQRSIELADVVYTPSSYLVKWLTDGKCEAEECQGSMWKFPSIDNIHLLPFLPGPEVKEIAAERSPSSAKATELVFFGRLEMRKGLEMFCDALDSLSKENHQITIITFLGTPVKDIKGDLDSYEYINDRAVKGSWTFEMQYLSLGRHDALKYLKQEGRLAVIPSLYDNAPYTVFECLYLGIPFIASRLESIEPLMKKEEGDRILFDISSIALKNKILEVIQLENFVVAQPLFTIQQVEQMWLGLYSLFADKLSKLSQTADDFQPLVSACIIHHNRPALLTLAIDSINKQEYKNIEIIIVDDQSSTQESLELLSELQAFPEFFTNRPLRIIRNEQNRYLGASRNIAAKVAKGDFIYFLDDDNYAKANAISTYVLAAAHSDAKAFTAGHDLYYGLDTPSEAAITKRWLPLGPSLAAGLFKNCFGDANFFISRQTFLEVGGFTEEVMGAEDYEFHAKIVLKGVPETIIPESLLFYRLHDKNQMVFSNDRRSQIRALRPYYEALPTAHNELSTIILKKNSLDEDCDAEIISIEPAELVADFGGTLNITGVDFSCQDLINITIGNLVLDENSFTVESDNLISVYIPPLQNIGYNLDIVIQSKNESDVIKLEGQFSFVPRNERESPIVEVRIAGTVSDFDTLSFIQSLADILGINPSRIRIIGLLEGSVIVLFRIAAGSGADPPVTDTFTYLLQVLENDPTDLFANYSIVFLDYSVVENEIATEACVSGKIYDVDAEECVLTNAAGNCNFLEPLANSTAVGPIDLEWAKFVSSSVIGIGIGHDLVQNRVVGSISFNGNETCNYPGPFWIKGVLDPPSCRDLYFALIPWEVAYISGGVDQVAYACGLQRDDSDPDVLWFNGNLQVDYYDDLSQFIPDLQRHSRWKFPFRLGFPKTIEISAGIVLFEDARIESALSEQIYDDVAGVLIVSLVTVSTYPYRFSAISATSMPTGISLSDSNLVDPCNETGVETCLQLWEFKFARNLVCTFSGVYVLTGNVTCKEGVPCPGDTVADMTIEIGSGNVCEVLSEVLPISDTIETFTSFDSTTKTFSDPKNAFLLGQQVHIKLEVESSGLPFNQLTLEYINSTDANGGSVNLLAENPASANLDIELVDQQSNLITYRISFVYSTDWFGNPDEIETTVIMIGANIEFENTNAKRSLNFEEQKTGHLAVTTQVGIVSLPEQYGGLKSTKHKETANISVPDNSNDISISRSTAYTVVGTLMGIVVGLVIVLGVFAYKTIQVYKKGQTLPSQPQTI